MKNEIRYGVISLWLLAMISCLCVYDLQAQDHETFSHLSVNDGLSQSTIFAITQDSKGFLWFGTRGGGLNNFDGYDFHVYRNVPELEGSLSDNTVRSILEDSQGVLWIGTRDGGIDRFDLATGTFRNYSLDALSEVYQDESPVVDAIFEDRSGNIWIGAKHRVYVYIPGEDRFEPMLVDAPFPVKGTTGICEDDQGYLYFATWDRLIRFHPEKNSYEELEFDSDPFSVFGGRMNPLLLDSRNRLWLGTPEGIKLVNTGEDFSFLADPFPGVDWPGSFDYIRTIEETRNGLIWLGTRDGLYSFAPETSDLKEYKTDPGNPSSLVHNSVYSIYEDMVGTLWVGTWSGISMVDRRKYEFDLFTHLHNDSRSLSNNIVSSFQEDRNGTWIGTEQGGLNFMDRERREFTTFQHSINDPLSLPNNNVKAIFLDSNQDLWVGTFNGGLSQYMRNGKFSNYLEGRSIYNIAEMPGGKLYMGGSDGLFVMDLGSRAISTNVFPSTSGISHFDGFVMALFTDSKNRLWIGTRNRGILLFDATRATVKQFQSIKEDTTTLSGNYVISFCEDSDQNIWIGTSSGLNRFEDSSQSFVRISHQIGLANYVINGLLSDGQDDLWISTNRGLYQYTYSSGDVLHYDYLDGLQSNEFNRGAAYRNSRGEMFFGGVSGFNVFLPEVIRKNPDAPPVIITDLKLFNRSVLPGIKNSPLSKHISDTEKIVLTHRQSSFSLDFVALNYLVPEKNSYAYMLEGYDEQWNQSGRNRTAAYMNLRPGNYTFRVLGSNNDGVLNTTGASLDIVIKGPLWSSPIALLIYVVTLVALLVVLVRIVSFRAEKESELNFERAEKARLVELNQMRLQFFTNISHEFRTPLTLISGPLKKLMSGKHEHQKEYLFGMMKSNVNRMLRLVNQLMDFRKIENEKMPLHISKGNLDELLSNIVFGFEDIASNKMIELKYSSDYQTSEDAEQWYDEGIVDKVTYNLLSNAFKFTPDQGIVEVHLIITEHTATLIVSDTGKGIDLDKVNRIFDRFYSENNEIYEGTGIGLSLSKRLIDLHKGEIKVESVKDKGSTFTVILPISKKDFAEDELFSGVETNNKVRPVLDADHSMASFNSNGIDTVKIGKSMLIAEDQKDLSLYLEEHFKEFDTVVAENGIIAYESAKEKIPDIIISDIMMPEMDGLDLCKKVKGNFLTSHIPVILLTAKTAIEQKLDGLDSGADAYVEKPFDAEYLSGLVKNLLAQRKKLREKFSGMKESVPDEENVNAAEKEFLEKVNGIVLKHVSEPEFSVEQLMTEVGMSRSQLYRKFKAISNRNPSEYIRILRLSHAARLLGENKYTINEVAFMSGFGNVSYFNTCFKRHYGTTPGKYSA